MIYFTLKVNGYSLSLSLSLSLPPFLSLSELITSVSQRCSQVIVDGNALTVLYDYINKSNRSRATLEMVKVCLQILLNVTKVH